MVAQAYNPRTRETAAKGSGVQGHPLLYDKLWVIPELYESLSKTSNKYPLGRYQVLANNKDINYIE